MNISVIRYDHGLLRSYRVLTFVTIGHLSGLEIDGALAINTREFLLPLGL